MKNRFADAKIGDKVYDRAYGYGKVCDVHSPRTIGVQFDYLLQEFLREGRAVLRNGSPAEEATLFYVDGDNKYAIERPLPKVPWDKVPVDTKIVTRSGCKRYYAGNGSYFVDGRTSWTAEVPSDVYSCVVSLAEPVTIDGVTYPVGSK